MIEEVINKMTQNSLEILVEKMGNSIIEMTNRNNKRLIIAVSVIHIVSIICIWFISK